MVGALMQLWEKAKRDGDQVKRDLAYWEHHNAPIKRIAKRDPREHAHQILLLRIRRYEEQLLALAERLHGHPEAKRVARAWLGEVRPWSSTSYLVNSVIPSSPWWIEYWETHPLHPLH